MSEHDEQPTADRGDPQEQATADRSEPQRGAPTADRGEPDGGEPVAPSSAQAVPATTAGGRLPVALAPVAHLAAREYRIALRQRWAYGLAALFAAYSLGVVAFGATTVGPSRYAAVVASLVEIGVYVVPLAALAFGYDVVVGADEAGSLELLFALPARRGAVVAGVFAGRAVALGGAMAAGFAPAGVLLAALLGPATVGPYAVFALAAVGTGLAFLAVSTAVSAVATEKTRALGVALAAWAWFVLLHDLAALGLVAVLELPDLALTALVVTNPADCFRLLVLGGLETTGGGFAALLSAAGLSPAVLATALLAWVAVPLAAAARLAGRRRL